MDEYDGWRKPILHILWWNPRYLSSIICTISSGDACRPWCLSNASDRLGELAQRAFDKDVQVIIEGPGYMPMYSKK